MTNAELAQKLRDLRDFLIVAGYEESHAFRYTHVARAIDKWPESAETMAREHRIKEIPQIGPLIAKYIKEIVQTGESSKQREWEDKAPYSVVEMCHVPGLGPKTVKLLWEVHQIASLSELKDAINAGELDEVLSAKVRSAALAHKEPERQR